MLEATNSGWQIKPTSRSEAAKQPKRMKDGEWRSRFFPIANRIRKFPKKVMRENKQLRIQVMIFVIKTSSSWSKIATLYSKKKQDLSVLFMTKKVPCSASNKTQWTAGPKFPRHSPLSPFLFLLPSWFSFWWQYRFRDQLSNSPKANLHQIVRVWLTAIQC